MIGIIKLVLGNFIVLFLMLLALEFYSRIKTYQPFQENDYSNIQVFPNGSYMQFDSLLGYKHTKGKHEITLKNSYHFISNHDSSSLRITSNAKGVDSLHKPEIWIFGCSFTHGWSVNDEETFAWILQENLDQFRIVNWGVSGYGTVHFYLQLQEALANKKKPAAVIINHADFHHERNTFSYAYKRSTTCWNKLGNIKWPSVELDSAGHLQIKFVENDYQPWSLSKYSALSYRIEYTFESIADQLRKAEELKITRILLKKIKNLCVQNEVKLIFANIGLEKDFIQKVSTDLEVPFVDISVDYTSNEYNNLPFDAHPNQKANQKYAEKIQDFLKHQLN